MPWEGFSDLFPREGLMILESSCALAMQTKPYISRKTFQSLPNSRSADFPKLIGRNGTQVEIRYDKNYNWSGFPDLLPNQMEGYCAHIRPATQCSFLMPPNSIRECSTREFIEPTLVMI